MDNNFTQPSFELEDLSVVIPVKKMKQFYDIFTSKGYNLMWTNDYDALYLSINVVTGMYQVPFIRDEKNDQMILSLKYIPIFHEDIRNCLINSVKKFKGNGILKITPENRILKYENGNLVSGNPKVSKKPSIVTEDGKLKLNRTIIEIDYYLSELNESIKKGEESKIIKLKDKLTKLNKIKDSLSK